MGRSEEFTVGTINLTTRAMGTGFRARRGRDDEGGWHAPWGWLSGPRCNAVGPHPSGRIVGCPNRDRPTPSLLPHTTSPWLAAPYPCHPWNPWLAFVVTS